MSIRAWFTLCGRRRAAAEGGPPPIFWSVPHERVTNEPLKVGGARVLVRSTAVVSRANVQRRRVRRRRLAAAAVIRRRRR